MDGDTAPIQEIIALSQQYNAHLIVDEAHATGVFGGGIVQHLNLQHHIFAQVTTFGKALGCHGAIVLGSSMLRSYLINFSRSFIYTTAAPFHQLASIKMAYELLADSEIPRKNLQQNIKHFKDGYINNNYQLITSNSAIQSIVLKSNHAAKALALLIQGQGFDVRPILSPTVAAGTERLRICLHAFNTMNHISDLLAIINNFGAS
jgi:8-amino-7-oxononanoate synthase